MSERFELKVRHHLPDTSVSNATLACHLDLSPISAGFFEGNGLDQSTLIHHEFERDR
jgi:hypothetical protein